MTRHNTMLFALTLSMVATLGSLYFSEVMSLAPCSLCWFQRIAMYPLVVIFATAIFENRPTVYKTALPLAGAGSAVSLYHNLLYFEVLPQSSQFCTAGVSCTTEYISWLGFITIPLLALVAFVLIIASSLYLWSKDS